MEYTPSCQPWIKKPARLFNWEGTQIKVSKHDYWGNTPLIVINRGLAKSGNMGMTLNIK
jgi:hypothetical protein